MYHQGMEGEERPARKGRFAVSMKQFQQSVPSLLVADIDRVGGLVGSGMVFFSFSGVTIHNSTTIHVRQVKTV